MNSNEYRQPGGNTVKTQEQCLLRYDVSEKTFSMARSPSARGVLIDFGVYSRENSGVPDGVVLNITGQEVEFIRVGQPILAIASGRSRIVVTTRIRFSRLAGRRGGLFFCGFMFVLSSANL